MSVRGSNASQMQHMIGGILRHVADMTRFLNPTVQSYNRLGVCKAPKYISWSNNNRSMLIRVPAASGEYRRMELRSPDCTANPYIAFALLIWAALDGLKNGIVLPEKANVNLYTAGPKDVCDMETLPLTLGAASKCAGSSAFIRKHLPESLIDYYCK